MLPLIWLWVIAVMLACKSDEINPVDKLMGLYQGTFPKGVIIMNTLNNVRLKKNGDFVHFTAYDVLFQKIRIPTTGGFEDRYKDFG
ncbi:MAG: hypothetical protein EAZ32_19880 [Cytophagia bacterium]|nr:MAG: hypothetical protein EAZ38_00900 [Cytophagales bacterium]TAG34170.1 MAG: hypothetical protein EAZ32_19880 [Cytophagia bacterium]